MANNPAGPADGVEAAAAAVTGLPQQVVAAWAAHDADAFAAVFTEEGTMILPGVFRQGRQEIRDFMADAFAGPYRGTQVTGEPLNLRFLNDTTAVLITKGGVLPPGASTVPSGQSIRATWLAVKQDQDWLLAAYQNTPSESP